MRSGVLVAVVDTGPLYAAADLDDDDHAASLAALQRRDLELVVPALVVAEATYLVGRRLGAKAEAAFLRGREYVVPEDVKAVARDVLRHRVITSYEAEAEELTSDDLVSRVIETVPVP